MPPILSIITPTWNRLHTLIRIPSALCEAAAEGGFEWLCADDGSTDGTNEYLVKSYRSFPFPTTIILSSIRIGKSCLDNLLIKHSTGRFICWCDSDDLINVSSLATVVRELKKLPPDLSGLCLPAYLPTGQTIGDWSSFRILDTSLNLLASVVRPNMNNSDGCIVFRADLLKLRPFPEVDFYAPESSVFELMLLKTFRCISIPFLMKSYDPIGAVTDNSIIQYPYGYAIAELSKYHWYKINGNVRIKLFKSFMLYHFLAKPSLIALFFSNLNGLNFVEYLLMLLLLPFVFFSFLKTARKPIFRTHEKFIANKCKTILSFYFNYAEHGTRIPSSDYQHGS